MKVALVYDRVNKWGGAERVLLTLHEMYPNAPLFTSVYNSVKATWAKVFPEVKTSFLQKAPLVKNHHEQFPFLMPIAFESFDFSSFDLVISVTSEAAKGIITRPPTKHVCYCLTPTRYLWSHYEEYFRDASFKNLSKPVVNYLRAWDKIAAQRPDVLIGISSAVQKRIEEYYNRDSELVFPPVNNEKFETRKTNFETHSTEYFLIVSRLVPYKKVDLAIEAFNQLGEKLIVAGSGKEEANLKGLAKKNVSFLGEVKDNALIGYYQNAKALIMPQEEDFGLVSVEAQASGCPVIAYKKGGALDTVIEGKTGVFFESQTSGSLIKAIEKFKGITFKNKDLRQNAERFSKEKFKESFTAIVDKALYSQ